MSTSEQQKIIDQIKARLSELGKAHHTELCVDEEGTKFEDDWFYVCVESPDANIRVSDYAELLSTIEQELRAEQKQNIILIPTLKSTPNP